MRGEARVTLCGFTTGADFGEPPDLPLPLEGRDIWLSRPNDAEIVP